MSPSQRGPSMGPSGPGGPSMGPSMGPSAEAQELAAKAARLADAERMEDAVKKRKQKEVDEEKRQATAREEDEKRQEKAAKAAQAKFRDEEDDEKRLLEEGKRLRQANKEQKKASSASGGGGKLPGTSDTKNAVLYNPAMLREAAKKDFGPSERSGNKASSSGRSSVKEYTIHLDKTKGQGLGVNVATIETEASLSVEDVGGGKGTLVRDWNDANPDMMVKPGDRIVDVNGVHGDAGKIIGQLKMNQHLVVKLLRG